MPGTTDGTPNIATGVEANNARTSEVPDTGAPRNETPWSGGVNAGGGSNVGVGINTGDRNPKESDWDRTARTPQNTQLLGAGDSIELRPGSPGGQIGNGQTVSRPDSLIDPVGAATAVGFVAATGAVAPGGTVATAGGYTWSNQTGLTLQSGDWVWCTGVSTGALAAEPVTEEPQEKAPEEVEAA